MKLVDEHDELLRGNGGHDGLLHTVREIEKDRQERKKLQTSILIGVIALVIERIVTFAGFALKNL